MTKIGQKKTSGNCFQKLKNLESSECWPKLYKTMLNKVEIAYADPSFYENCYPYFWVEICNIPNISGFKIFNESMLLGFN